VIGFARRTDDIHPACGSKLNGEGAYPACGRVDEQRLAGLDAELLQHRIRCAASPCQGTGDFPTDFTGLADEVRRRREGILGE
jgi:hypothetical protein